MFPSSDPRFIVQFGTPGHYNVNMNFNFTMQTTTNEFHNHAPLGPGNFQGMNPNPENHYDPPPQIQQYGNGPCGYIRALPPPCNNYNDFSSSSFEASVSSNAPGSSSNSWRYVPPQTLQNGYSPPYTPCNNHPAPFFNGGKPFQASTPSTSFGDDNKTFINSTSDSTQGGCFSSKKCNII